MASLSALQTSGYHWKALLCETISLLEVFGFIFLSVQFWFQRSEVNKSFSPYILNLWLPFYFYPLGNNCFKGLLVVNYSFNYSYIWSPRDTWFSSDLEGKFLTCLKLMACTLVTWAAMRIAPEDCGLHKDWPWPRGPTSTWQWGLWGHRLESYPIFQGSCVALGLEGIWKTASSLWLLELEELWSVMWSKLLILGMRTPRPRRRQWLAYWKHSNLVVNWLKRHWHLHCFIYKQIDIK